MSHGNRTKCRCIFRGEPWNEILCFTYNWNWLSSHPFVMSKGFKRDFGEEEGSNVAARCTWTAVTHTEKTTSRIPLLTELPNLFSLAVCLENVQDFCSSLSFSRPFYLQLYLSLLHYCFWFLENVVCFLSLLQMYLISFFPLLIAQVFVTSSAIHSFIPAPIHVFFLFRTFIGVSISLPSDVTKEGYENGSSATFFLSLLKWHSICNVITIILYDSVRFIYENVKNQIYSPPYVKLLTRMMMLTFCLVADLILQGLWPRWTDGDLSLPF